MAHRRGGNAKDDTGKESRNAKFQDGALGYFVFSGPATVETSGILFATRKWQRERSANSVKI